MSNKTVHFAKRSLDMSQKRGGFTLVELLIVIAIIGILAAIVALVINPVELTKRSRDAARLTDMANLQLAINVALQESTATNAICNQATPPCSGNSVTDTRASNGSGWAKVDLSGQKSVSMPTLPVDPLNNSTYQYKYFANNNASGSPVWEINTVLESQQYSPKMKSDGGNNDNAYEIGTDLTLIN